MPIVEITMIEGRTEEAVEKLLVKVTDAVVETIAAPRESVRVIINEVPAKHFAIGGVPKSRK